MTASSRDRSLDTAKCLLLVSGLLLGCQAVRLHRKLTLARETVEKERRKRETLIEAARKEVQEEATAKIDAAVAEVQREKEHEIEVAVEAATLQTKQSFQGLIKAAVEETKKQAAEEERGRIASAVEEALANKAPSSGEDVETVNIPVATPLIEEKDDGRGPGLFARKMGGPAAEEDDSTFSNCKVS